MSIYKRTLALIISIFVLLVTFSVSGVKAEGATIIENVEINTASFDEVNGDIWGVTPKDWIQKSDNLSYQISQENNGFDGEYLMLYKNSQVAKNNTFIFTSDYAAITENISYKFGVKFKSTTVDNSNCFVTVTLYDANNNEITAYQGEQVFVTEKASWVDVSVSVPATDGAVNAKLTVTANVDSLSGCGLDYAYGVATILSTDTGASIRLAQDSPGLRFTAKVDKAVYDKYSENYGAEVGIIIVPVDYVTAAGEFTVEALIRAGKTYLEIQAKLWNNSATYQTDGYYGFSCAIVNIKPDNVKREFCARSYMKYTVDGETVYIYGNYDYTDQARSVNSVANKVLEYIDEYDEIEQNIINAYASGQVPVFD